jgi:hypothetical protein
LDTVISALAVLSDNTETEPLAVRAAALDAAITHMAGNGCKVADSAGNGNAVVGIAGTFEAYLTGVNTVAVPDVEVRLMIGSLANAIALLSAAGFTEQDDAENWAQRRDATVAAFDRLLDQLTDRLADHLAATGGR